MGLHFTGREGSEASGLPLLKAQSGAAAAILGACMQCSQRDYSTGPIGILKAETILKPIPVFQTIQTDILVLKHESRKITYFWVVRKFKVLVFRSGWFGLDKTGLKISDWIFPHPM